jgi:hypothetical protein
MRNFLATSGNIGFSENSQLITQSLNSDMTTDLFQVATLVYRIGNAAHFNSNIYPAIILQIFCGPQALLARNASHALTISSSVHFKSSLYHSRQQT